MKLTIVHTDNAPQAIGPYSQAVIHGDTMYISGQIPVNPATGEIVSDDIALQTKQCIENAEAIIKKAGADLNSVIKTTVFIKNMEQFSQINQVYAQYFSNHKPARACVEVARLPKDVLIEIEMIVAI